MRESGLDFSRPLVVALSGGPDSTALILTLAGVGRNVGLHIYAAYFDHQINTNVDFPLKRVIETCSSLQIPISTGSGDVPRFAKLHRLSIEESARIMRYRFLSEKASELGASGVVTAHTLDDQAETILMNILRGSGIRGAVGMKSKSTMNSETCNQPLDIFRPMLTIRKSECVQLCRSERVPFFTDPSNADDKFTRNRVRSELMPVIESIYPGSIRALARFGNIAALSLNSINAGLQNMKVERISDKEAWIDRYFFQEIGESLHPFALISLWRKVVKNGKELGFVHVSAMRHLIDSDKTGTLDMPCGMKFVVEVDRLGFALSSGLPLQGKTNSALFFGVSTIQLPRDGQVELPGGFSISCRTLLPPLDFSAVPTNVAYLDNKACAGKLTVRARRPGDRFSPLGMKQSVLLKKFFINSKIPETYRDHIPLVECSRGIAWIAGVRLAEWAKVTDSNAPALRLEFISPLETFSECI